MNHQKALLLLSIFIVFLSGCGEQENLEPSEGEQGSSQGSSWIIGTWTGTQRAQRAGQTANSASVQMKFFANQVYHLNFPEHSSNFVKGKYVVNSDRTILLKVEKSSAKLYAVRPIPESFQYNHQSPQLRIYNKEVQINLQLKDNTDEQNEASETSESLFSLFDSWTCFDDKHLWKVSIFEDESFYLRRYAPDNRLPTERAGKLASYKETPNRNPEEKKAHILFYMDQRKLNLLFKINQQARTLKVEYFQGSIRPNSPSELSCFR
ncbi:MAG: hypothetical protein AB8G05_08640 [Oligoflexales bacterium]